MLLCAKGFVDFFFLSSSDVYLRDDGEVVQEGDIIKDPVLAQTMQRIADDPHTFYEGGLAGDIIDDLNDAGKFLICYK